METLQLSTDNLSQVVERSAAILGSGGVILYPTDTLYGLGADAFSDDAVAKIYRIKGRDEGKPIHALVDSIEMAARYGEISERVNDMVRELPKGKVTFVVRKKAGVEGGIARDRDTFGFRIPDNEFCLAMIRAFGGPITATSANKAGETPPSTPSEIFAQLGANAAAVNLVLDAGELPTSQPSSVVDVSTDDIKVLREGVVPAADILELFGN